MTRDDTLSAFFAEATPPARDFGFQAVVAERIARRRAFATVGALIPWTIAAITLCWAIAPLVGPVLVAMTDLFVPAVAILALTGMGVVAATNAGRRLARV